MVWGSELGRPRYPADEGWGSKGLEGVQGFSQEAPQR